MLIYRIVIFRVIKILTYNFFSYWRKIDILFKLTPHYTEMMETIKTIKQTSTEVSTYYELIIQFIKKSKSLLHKSYQFLNVQSQYEHFYFYGTYLDCPIEISDVS